MGPAPIVDPPEMRVLLSYLNRVRDAVVTATNDLSEQQLRAPGVGSGTNLLGLVHHLTGVEEHWLRRVFLGEQVEADKSMIAPPDAAVVDVVAAYRQACRDSDQIVERCDDLSTPAAVPNPGEPQRDSLRIILTHLIEETARHAGHADILREAIDGRTQ